MLYVLALAARRLRWSFRGALAGYPAVWQELAELADRHGGLRHGLPFQSNPAKHLVLDLQQVAGIEPFVRKEQFVGDGFRGWIGRAPLPQDGPQSERADLAVKAFELSQAPQEKWVTADIPEKRQLLEIVCLNLQLDGASLVPTMRKPFDVLAEGFTSMNTRGDCPDFEPSEAIGPYVATFLHPPEPYILRIGSIL